MNRAAALVISSQVLAVAASACLLLAGCGNPHRGASASPDPPPRFPLTTAVTTASASWAVVRTGGARAGGTFWQLLVRPAAAGRWRLVTPAGVADHGGLVLAPAPGGVMAVAFVPSAHLRFTPLATTADDGAHWSRGLLPARLAALPGALAALPGGRLLALTATGVLESGPGGSGWKRLVTLKTLAASAAGRACGLTALTAVAAGPSGMPLLGGTCDRPGTLGVFRQTPAGWQFVVRSRQARLAAPTAVLRFAAARGSTTVLFSAGSARRPRYEEAALGLSPAPIAVSPLPVLAARRLTATFVDTIHGWGGVAGGRVATCAAPAAGNADSSGSFHLTARLPGPGIHAVPAATLLTAFVPAATSVAVWSPGKQGGWRRTQVIAVPER